MDFLKKCLDKDPNKRWNCDRLSTHPYFEDYKAKYKEMEAMSSTPQTQYNTNKQSDKTKNSNTSLPQLPASTGANDQPAMRTTHLRSEHHLPTI